MPNDSEHSDGDGQRVLHFEREGYSHRQPTRLPKARGPEPEPARLRNAYLDVLKLCLCDLGGASTTSVWQDPGGTIMSRQLRGDELSIRALGVDWPLQGLTMVGLNRLDDLQECVETIVEDGIEGDLIEAGSWRGGASILMRATLNTLGERERSVCVADSFEGFPVSDERETEQLAAVSFLAVPVEDVQAHFARFGCERGVEFVQGYFQETLGALAGRRWSLLRLDGDSYEATWAGLEALYPYVSAGGFVVVDDYGALDACQRAVDDFRREQGIEDPIEPIDWTGARWRKTAAPAERSDGEPQVPAPVPGPKLKRADRSVDTRVRSIEELAAEEELREQLERLQERLEAAEAEVEGLKRERGWLGRLRGS